MSDIEVLQVPSEFKWLLGIFRERKPKRVLEIGSWQGGTLREWLKGKPERAVAVDLDHQRAGLYESWMKDGTELCVVEGDSQSEDVQKQVRELGPFDWIFIDGDHSEQGVNSDWKLALEVAAPAAIVVLHDVARGIHNEGDPAPGRLFESLSREYRTEANVEDNAIRSPHWAHGIGVVYLP